MYSFPFDSQITGTDAAGLPIYDRASTSEDLANWFKAFFTNGVFANGGFAVTANGLTVSVSAGDCLINGRYAYEKETRLFTLAGGGTQPRIDTVVLRLDLSLDARKIDLFIKNGTPAASPVAPSLDRDDIVWELGIANIYVAAKATSVSTANVTDTRLATDRCGIVAQAMTTLDTKKYYNQIQADLNEFRTNEENLFKTWADAYKLNFDNWSDQSKAEFVAWFETLVNVMEGDQYGNLLALLTSIQFDVNAYKRVMTVTDDGIDLNGKYIDNAVFR